MNATALAKLIGQAIATIRPSARLLAAVVRALLIGVPAFVAACQPLGLSGPSTANNPGPQDEPVGTPREQHWLVPQAGARGTMTATLWMPKGAGPYPLAVIIHASSQDPKDRIQDPTPRYQTLVAWFLQRGYAVLLPVRPGHGATGGPYLEDQGGCDDADFRASGDATAVTIEAALDYMTAQPFVKKSGAVVVGQSAGGWGALALASRNPPQVRAVINFAGGRGAHVRDVPNEVCAVDRLVATAREYGSASRVPTLWIYAANDTYFGPELSKRMADAFKSMGGLVEYHQVPAARDEGHFLVGYPETAATWGPIVEKFLARGR